MAYTCLEAFHLVLFLACLALFLLQSYQEFVQFFSGLTSTAMTTVDDLDLGYPTITLCPQVAFRYNSA